MSLSFSVTSDFVRPFISILSAACKQGDTVFLIPADGYLEVIGVHPHATAHLLITIDAVHLEGYRYSAFLPRELPTAVAAERKTAALKHGQHPIDPATLEESFVAGTASGEEESEVLASATTCGSGNGGSNSVNNGSGSNALCLPTAALQATLLHQSTNSIQSLQVRYTSLAVATAAAAATTAREHAANRPKPEMLCIACVLNTGVVKTHQLHLAQGTEMRMAATGLRDYHLEVRALPRVMGLMLASMPTSTTQCTMAPGDGQLELRWYSAEAERESGAARTKRGHRASGGAAGGETDGVGINVVTAQTSSFTAFRYFTADAAKAAETGRADSGPEVVSSVPFHPLPGKVVDVKPIKQVALLASELRQELQVLLGDAGAPVALRTGAAAETFIVQDGRSSGDGMMGAKSVALYQGSKINAAAAGRLSAASGAPLMSNPFNNDAALNVSFAMHVFALDVENPSIKDTVRNSGGTVSGRTSASIADRRVPRGSAQSAGVAASSQQQRLSFGGGDVADTTDGGGKGGPSAQASSCDAATAQYGLSYATTLVMGGTESSGTPQSHLSGPPLQKDGSAAAPHAGDPFLTPYASATPEQQDRQLQHQPPRGQTTHTQQSSMAGLSHVSPSPLQQQPLSEGRSSFMVGATPSASVADNSAFTSQAVLAGPSIASSSAITGSLTPQCADGRASDNAVYITSPQRTDQQQQQQPFLFTTTVSGGDNADTASTAKPRLSSLYPLDYAAFASQAAASLRLNRIEGANGEVHFHGLGSLPGGGIAEEVGGSGVDELSDTEDEIDVELQQFLDSCSTMLVVERTP